MENRGFEEKVAVYISENRLFDIGSRVLVTVSGGADSVALLCLLNGLGYDCVAAHCNFHLRGEESMRDERFVRALCGKLGVECVVRDFDVPAYMAEHKVSMEMACRELRYGWFEEVRESSGCAVIAVAHHSDDSVETFFLNMLRGCGIAGLAGIKPVNGRIVRPFLCVSRADIEEYLQEIRQDYIVDSTNLESGAQYHPSGHPAMLPGCRCCITAHFVEYGRKLCRVQRCHPADKAGHLHTRRRPSRNRPPKIRGYSAPNDCATRDSFTIRLQRTAREGHACDDDRRRGIPFRPVRGGGRQGRDHAVRGQ